MCLDKPSLHTGGFLTTKSFPHSFRFFLVSGSKQYFTILIWLMFYIPLILGSYIFGSVPSPVRLTRPDCKLKVFPRVSGYPYNKTVNPSHFRLEKRSVVLLCSVSDPLVSGLKWKTDFGYVGIPVSDTTRPSWLLKMAYFSQAVALTDTVFCMYLVTNNFFKTVNTNFEQSVFYTSFIKSLVLLRHL